MKDTRLAGAGGGEEGGGFGPFSAPSGLNEYIFGRQHRAEIEDGDV